MVQKVETTITLIDDLDGSKADRTVTFTVQGKAYEIDLSKKNATAFDKVVAPYIAAARRPTQRGSKSTNRGTRSTSRGDLAAIREWAHAQGIEVSVRGRVAKTVQDAYDAAH